LKDSVDIQAIIDEGKALEFSQSKLVFLEELQGIDGYLGYTENPGTNFHLSIVWESRQKLDFFMKSELFRFFRGAIITLGQGIEVTIKSQSL
jgi:hypothetical protein